MLSFGLMIQKTGDNYLFINYLILDFRLSLRLRITLPINEIANTITVQVSTSL